MSTFEKILDVNLFLPEKKKKKNTQNDYRVILTWKTKSKFIKSRSEFHDRFSLAHNVLFILPTIPEFSCEIRGRLYLYNPLAPRRKDWMNIQPWRVCFLLFAQQFGYSTTFHVISVISTTSKLDCSICVDAYWHEGNQNRWNVRTFTTNQTKKKCTRRSQPEAWTQKTAKEASCLMTILLPIDNLLDVAFSTGSCSFL